MNRPSVGCGVFVKKDGKYLLGKRTGSHGEGEYSLPGGHLEGGESFEDCCKREVKEETNLEIENVVPITFTNDIFPKKHYVTLFFMADYKSGELINVEPEKCEGWEWYDKDEFPKPLFCSTEEVLKMI